MPPTHHGYEEHDDIQVARPSPEESDFEEKVEQEEEKKVDGSKGEEVAEVQEGVLNGSDTEMPLEKRKTLRSIQDPNLVSVLEKHEGALYIDLYSRLHGTGQTIQKTQRTGPRNAGGLQRSSFHLSRSFHQSLPLWWHLP